MNRSSAIGEAKRWVTAAALGMASLGGALLPASVSAAPTDGELKSLAEPPLAYRASIGSPEPLPRASDPLYAICGEPDAALRSVAARAGGRLRRGEGPMGSDELSFQLRVAGAPYVWPRAWATSGTSLDEEAIKAALATFVDKAPRVGVRRCGVARLAGPNGQSIVSVVMVDAVADLEPIATMPRVGSWVSLRGRLHVPSSDAKVLLLGPRGGPKVVLASLSKGEVLSRFSVDQVGPWLVQVVATTPSGPRPVLELQLYAGVLPEDRFAERPAPGEEAGETASGEAAAPAGDPARALLAMMNAARKSEGLAPLIRDSSLDALALAHTKKMAEARRVAHDAGDGDFGARLAEAGLSVRRQGENVAAASSLARAHRALWQSPSHRQNLLDGRFSNVGVGVIVGADGRTWVTQVFTDGLRSPVEDRAP